ncbi:MAG TPA: PHP domain-containing protein [Vicinamibacterales bacterium]|nr:PHP domain-containing protein [Vicinamibacterales bacterium]
MIDLHTHTTASDGRCTPAELVARAQAAGVTVLGVTDHDTVAGCDAAGAACVAAGIGFVAGIEITAVREEADLHILGYFIDSSAPPLLAFLARQRQQRIERVRRMIAKLADLGIPLDADTILRRAVANPGVAIGRPWIARALVASGHVTTTSEAFSSWLGRGRPAFVAREGATAADVIAHIHDAGGIVSMAHPGVTGRDAWIPDLVAAGLDAIEVYHMDHDEAATERYRAVAERYGLAISGGSDFHGDESHGAPQPGSVSLPKEEYERLRRSPAIKNLEFGIKNS